MVYIRNVLILAMALMAFTIMSSTAGAEEEAKSAGTLFFEAFQKQDQKGMDELIETRTDEFPQEVIEMVKYAMNPEISPEEQDYVFSVAGMIARMFGEKTGDNRLFDAVKMNYGNALEMREASRLNPAAVDKTKKEITAMGKEAWRINVFKLEADGSLVVDIDVRESSGASSFETPKISIKQSREVVELIKTNHPKVKKGKVTWYSMGVGLKTAFIE